MTAEKTNLFLAILYNAQDGPLSQAVFYMFTLGKYSLTKSTSLTWKERPFKWDNAPASVVNVKVSL